MYAKIAGLSAFSVLIGLSMTSVGFGQTKAGPTPSPKGAAVYFIDLKNGATIGEKTTVHFGLHGWAWHRRARRKPTPDTTIC